MQCCISEMEPITADNLDGEQAESGGTQDSRRNGENLLNEGRENNMGQDLGSELFVRPGSRESDRSRVSSESELAQSERADKIERKLAQCMEAYLNVCQMWKLERRNTVNLLRKLADDIQKDEGNSRIAKLAGASSSIVGTVLAMGGAVAAWFTFGASLVLTVVETGIAAAGGTTLAGTEIVNNVLRSRNVENINEALRRDSELTEYRQNQFAAVRRFADELEVLRRKNLAASCLSIATKAYTTVATAYRIGKTVGGEAGVTVFRALGGGGSRVLHVVGIVACAVTLPVDVYTLVSTSVNVHNGSIF